MATRKILEKMKQDESHRSFEGSSGVHSDGDDLDDTDDDDAASNLGIDQGMESTTKPAKSAKGARPSGPGQTRRVYGNMTGLEDDDSLDSDSDMLLDGDSNDSDDDAGAETLKNRKSAKLAKAAIINNNSDDDF